MKLEKILNLLNSLEKNSFLKIIDGIISESPKNAKEIDVILSEGTKELKSEYFGVYCTTESGVICTY